MQATRRRTRATSAARPNRPNRTQQVSRRGAALVEFAIMTPLFVLLIMGTMEAGNSLELGMQLTAAVREGGRLASMDWQETVPNGMTANEKVAQDIRNFLTATGVPGEQVEIAITSAEGSDAGQPFDLSDPNNRLRLFEISASIPYSAYNAAPATFMAGKTVSTSTVFRNSSAILTQ
mgnify:FL=1